MHRSFTKILISMCFEILTNAINASVCRWHVQSLWWECSGRVSDCQIVRHIPCEEDEEYPWDKTSGEYIFGSCFKIVKWTLKKPTKSCITCGQYAWAISKSEKWLKHRFLIHGGIVFYKWYSVLWGCNQIIYFVRDKSKSVGAGEIIQIQVLHGEVRH